MGQFYGKEVAAKIGEDTWKFFQQPLGYTDEEMGLFTNARNEEVLPLAPAFMGKTIVAEVVESCGCNSRHKVGDTFYFDGAGNLISKLNPGRVCISVLTAVAPLVFTSNELFYAGVDPNAMRFKRTGCYDVGVRCGGWGHIALELKVIDREK